MTVSYNKLFKLLIDKNMKENKYGTDWILLKDHEDRNTEIFRGVL